MSKLFVMNSTACPPSADGKLKTEIQGADRTGVDAGGIPNGAPPSRANSMLALEATAN